MVSSGITFCEKYPISPVNLSLCYYFILVHNLSLSLMVCQIVWYGLVRSLPYLWYCCSFLLQFKKSRVTVTKCSKVPSFTMEKIYCYILEWKIWHCSWNYLLSALGGHHCVATFALSSLLSASCIHTSPEESWSGRVHSGFSWWAVWRQYSTSSSIWVGWTSCPQIWVHFPSFHGHYCLILSRSLLFLFEKTLLIQLVSLLAVLSVAASSMAWF